MVSPRSQRYSKYAERQIKKKNTQVLTKLLEKLAENSTSQ